MEDKRDLVIVEPGKFPETKLARLRAQTFAIAMCWLPWCIVSDLLNTFLLRFQPELEETVMRMSMVTAGPSPAV